METEVKKVTCEYCKGTCVVEIPTFSASSDKMSFTEIPCLGCEGSGQMEIRRTMNHEWASMCLGCEGKGFQDGFDSYREEHFTFECEDCRGTGGITYTPPAE